MRGPSSRISAHFEQFGAGTISTRRAFTVPHSSPPLKPRVLPFQPCPGPIAHVARADALPSIVLTTLRIISCIEKNRAGWALELQLYNSFFVQGPHEVRL